MLKRVFLLSYLLIFSIVAFSQQLSQSAQSAIDQKSSELSAAQASGNIGEQFRLNKEIADIYQKNSLAGKAISHYEAAIGIARNLAQPQLIRNTALALSMCYMQTANYVNAATYLSEANKYTMQLVNSKKVYYDEQINIAAFYRKAKNYAKAFELLRPLEQKIIFEAYDDNLVDKYYQEVATVCQLNGDNANYAKYSQVIEKRKLEKTKEVFNQQTNIYKEDISEKEKEIQQKNQTLTSYQDSLEKAEAAKRESDYQLKIKEQDLQLKQAELDNEKLVSRALTFGLLFLLVVIMIISYLLVLINKSKNEIKKQKEEIEHQNSLLEQKNVEIEQQNSLLAQQNSEIEQQNKEINSRNEQIKGAITYAKTIQVAALPPESELNRHFPLFKIYLPKDIVSGDFYWHASRNLPSNDHLVYYYAVVDCTGHGVPGAFMSLIGIRLLNEILFEKNVTEPAAILTRLNKELQKALNQSENSNDDGMDVALIRIEHKEDMYHVIYAGANRPFIYFDNSDNELKYQRGNLATIGGIEGKRFSEEFTDFHVMLKHNDMIYLTSDGLVDQNNPYRKKYGSKRLLDLLAQISKQPLELQKEAIEADLEEHRQDTAQRDDITLMGIKLV